MSCTRGCRGEGVVFASASGSGSDQVQIRFRSRVSFFLRKLRSRNARPRWTTEYVHAYKRQDGHRYMTLTHSEGILPRISHIPYYLLASRYLPAPFHHAVSILSNLSQSHSTVRTPYLARLAGRQHQRMAGGSSERFSEASYNGDGQEARPASTKAAQPSPQPPLTHHTRYQWTHSPSLVVMCTAMFRCPLPLKAVLSACQRPRGDGHADNIVGWCFQIEKPQPMMSPGPSLPRPVLGALYQCIYVLCTWNCGLQVPHQISKGGHGPEYTPPRLAR